MKSLILLCLLILPNFALAAQKAKILGQVVEVYSDDDFDSEVMDEVYQGETYSVSDKAYGPFYRIKLKSGKVGYVVDYELDIEGKGPLQPKDLDALELQSEKEFFKNNPQLAKTDAEAEEEVFGKPRSGPLVQLMNFHESTMGQDQVDDLAGIGWKSLATVSWSVLASFGLPDYYTKAAGNSGQGLKLWADVGFSNTVSYFTTSELRFAGNFFTQFSYLSVKTPLRSYDMQDITLGINLEAGLLMKFKSFAMDLALKYYFDKSNYAGLAFSVLF